jgi:predicted nucleic acid-binding protein
MGQLIDSSIFITLERRNDSIKPLMSGSPEEANAIASITASELLLHAQLGAQLAAVGQAIGAHDLIIAATAVAHGYRLLTDNLRHFQRIPGLVVIQPRWD